MIIKDVIFIKNYVNLNEYPVKPVLGILLSDRTTENNIIFATDEYQKSGRSVDVHDYITEDVIQSFGMCDIQPRVSKSLESQADRTKTKAEVFTPSWICNKMNNYCDEEWFGTADVFNKEDGQSWIVNENPIPFPDGKTWKDYVLSKRLEITCGEAPYLVSRYDTTSGEPIEISRRIGILDRKLRVINENVEKEKDWFKWIYKAFESVYGYEFQGDNLLIARVNLLNTFVDYVQARWDKAPATVQLKKIAEIISWNIWQMDGLKGTVPFGEIKEEDNQISFFDMFSIDTDEPPEDDGPVECVIKDWETDETITYNEMKEGK